MLKHNNELDKRVVPYFHPIFFLHWGSFKPGSLNFPPHFDTFHLKLIQTCNYSHAIFLFFSIISNHIHCCFGISASFFSRGPHFIDLRWAKSEAPIRVLMVSHPNGWEEDTLFSLFDYFHCLYIRHGRWEIQCNRGWTFKVSVNRRLNYCL